MDTKPDNTTEIKDYLDTIGIKTYIDPLGQLVIDLNTLPDRMSVPVLFELIETLKID